MRRGPASKIATKIRRLARIADELREGADFSITRLTTVKSLCEDPEAAARFALHMAELARDRMEYRRCPDHVEPAEWSHYKALAANAIRQMENYLEGRTSEASHSLKAVLLEIKQVQNEYRNLSWGPVRIIVSRELLLVENALHCVLRPTESAYWGYQIAKDWAERYAPRYGTGLIPVSAPMVEDVADFWCRYHFGKPLNEWLGASKS